MSKALFLIPLLATLAQPVAALTLDLPAKVLGEETRSANPASYALPVAAFNGITCLPSRSRARWTSGRSGWTRQK